MTTPEQEPSKYQNAIRAEGEQDRPDEFKQSREQLLSFIDDTFKKLVQMQSNGDTVTHVNETQCVIKDEPIISQVDLGKHPRLRDVRKKVEERRIGASLYGDGITSPFVFEVAQLVNGGIEQVRMTGSNPMLKRNPNGSVDYSFDQQNLVAGSVAFKRIEGDGRVSRDEQCTIRGNGSVDLPPIASGQLDHYAQKTEGLQFVEATLGIELDGLVRGQ